MRLQISGGRGALAAVLVLAVALAAAVLLLFSPHKGPATPAVRSAAPAKGLSPAGPTPPVGVAQTGLTTLQGAAFTTSFHSTWSVWRKERTGGAHRYQLSSTHGQPSKLGIPPAGAVGITIDESPATPSAEMRFTRAAAGRSIVSLMRYFVGTPREALGVTLASPPRRSNLAGAEAGIESYGYTYRGVKNIQVDLLADRGGNVVLIELDTEPELATQGEAALETLGKRWRWR